MNYKTSYFLHTPFFRYEEFLLALRNFDISEYVRGRSWADPSYFRGPDIEEGFRYFPYKLPSGISMGISRDVSYHIYLQSF